MVSIQRSKKKGGEGEEEEEEKEKKKKRKEGVKERKGKERKLRATERPEEPYVHAIKWQKAVWEGHML